MDAHWSHPDCVCGDKATQHKRHYSPGAPKYLGCRRKACSCMKYVPPKGLAPNNPAKKAKR